MILNLQGFFIPAVLIVASVEASTQYVVSISTRKGVMERYQRFGLTSNKQQNAKILH